MMQGFAERLSSWRCDLENYTLGLIIAMIQIQRAKRHELRKGPAPDPIAASPWRDWGATWAAPDEFVGRG